MKNLFLYTISTVQFVVSCRGAGVTEAVAGMVDLQAQYKMPIIGRIISTITTFFGMNI